MKKISCTFSSFRAWQSLALGIFMLCAGGTFAQTQECAQSTGQDPIISNGGAVMRTITVANIPADQNIEEISLETGITHTWAGDINITLEAPNNTVVTVKAGNFDSFGSGDFSNNGPILWTDESSNVGGGCFGTSQYCVNCGFCDYSPANPLDFGFANSSEANGDWTLTVVDNVGGDDGTLFDAELCISYIEPPTCDVTCPEDITIDLDPGACTAQYSYAPILEGTDPLCMLVPEPIECFHRSIRTRCKRILRSEH